ncbi:helix-turn-helix domain-containing protein [Larkinella insperata]|uniref:Helix-turn-helix domain-containing protein n=1 Tax=Larkinella insperata TaxID=332158 RepID=A0ABW3QF49_9BACT|nr:helix-turn-helix transcriptional regulator [Larkinella insperata]
MKILPVQIDVYALIILLGVVQGLFLGIFFLTGKRGQSIANRCHGWLTLALAALSGEIFLNYTNYTFQALWTVDFSEPLNFVIGPLFYFYTFSRIWKRLPRRWGWHLLPFAIWLVNSVTWFYQPLEYKYNSYLHSQHPEMPYIDADEYLEEDFTELRRYINEMTLVSCLIYAAISLLTIRKATQRKPDLRSSDQLQSLRFLSWMFALVPLLIVIVKPQFQRDVGDYLLATYIATTIYATSFLVMRGSVFFREDLLPEAPAPEPELPADSRKKYERSSLSEEVEESLLNRLNRLFEAEKPYLESDLSLPKLAQRLNTSPHHLSQLLNDRLEQNFFDLLATYRVREAQQLLCDPATVNLKIDEIAERVGYNSTSAFHTAFKRLTGQTPAQFRATATSSRSA